MKKFQWISLLFLALFLFSSCEEDCEKNNTYEIFIENSALQGTLQVNIDTPFTSINGPSDFSIPAGESLSITVTSGSHTVRARQVVTITQGSRTEVRVTTQPDEEVNQSNCQTATLVY